jgi:hypothetical protein
LARVAQYLSEPVATHLAARRTVSRIWYVYAFLAAALVLYIASLAVRPSYHQWLWLDGWVVFALGCAASILCLARGLVMRKDRMVPLLVGSSLLSWAIGSLLLTLRSSGGSASVSPSVANAFHFLFYLLAYGATMLLLNNALGRAARTNMLDGLVAGLGCAVVCGAFVFYGAKFVTGGSSLATATTLTYLIGDFLLLSLLIGGSLILGGRATAQWYVVAGALSLIVVGETFNIFQASRFGSAFGADFIRVAWPAGILLASVALWLRPRKLVD